MTAALTSVGTRVADTLSTGKTGYRNYWIR